MLKDEKGYIVVETIGGFMMLLFLCISILTLINVVTAQARIHGALTQTANTLSMYCYILEAIGVADDIKNISENAEAVEGEIENAINSYNEMAGAVNTIDETVDDMTEAAEGIPADISDLNIDGAQEKLDSFFSGFDTILGSMDTAVESGGELLGQAKGWAEMLIKNPKHALVVLAKFGMNSGKNYLVSEFVMRPMTEWYLSTEDLSGDDYLKKINVVDGIKGLDFNGGYSVDMETGALMPLVNIDKGTSFIDSDGNITIVVRYEVKFAFGALPLPFGSLNVTQTVKTKAWLGEKWKD